VRTLVIGDIHGCFDELQELLHRASLADGDRIVAVGDIVDRGPGTPKVLDFFARRGAENVVLGNHERKHIRSYRGEIQPALSQIISREQIGEAGYPDAIAFMSAFPRYIELPAAIIIHGYLEPGVPLESQHDTVLAGTMSGARRSQRYGDPWFKRYRGDKPLITGHENYGVDGRPLVYRDLVYGIDTECCRGGALTGVLLPEFEVLSVPARDDHWAAVDRVPRSAPRTNGRRPALLGGGGRDRCMQTHERHEPRP
jgi:serine/threonine protein phosphatase 1